MAARHVMIGSGPASISAAETIRGLDPGAEIIVVGAERYGYYSRPGLAYYLAREIPEKGLFPFTARDFGQLGISVVNERVVGIDRARHEVTLGDGLVLPYDRLLIATGSWAIPIDVPGVELDGVTKLDDMHDARDLITRSRGAKVAVAVGGGITGLEIVEGLCARHVKVHYFMRKDRYWGNVLSEAESRIVEDGLQARGVQVHHFTEIARIVGERGHVAAVETTDGTRIDCDLVAVAIGVLPQKELAEAAGLECGRGILVDRYLRSSDENIFAAGDIAEVSDPLTGRRTLEVLWNSAVAKGRIAGYNMVSGPVRAYEASTPLNVTRLAGFKITILGTVGGGTDADVKGIVRGDSETWRQAGDAALVETQVGDAHVRLALRERTVVGAVVMGDQALSFPLQEIIGTEADVGSLVAALQAPRAPVADLIDGFCRDWERQHA